MKKPPIKLKYVCLIMLICIMNQSLTFGAFLYKSYVVRQDRGWDILCDLHVVQKDDWVIKLFQRRGQIAEQDFPEFLSIFSRLNPHINDIDNIIPGQQILIPLKKLQQDSLPGQSSGIVTIPFVTISKLPDIIKNFSKQYTVQPGDCISKIVLKTYGAGDGKKKYKEGIELFKEINPGIDNLELIHPGQVLNIPDPSLQQQKWYSSLFDSKGKLNKDFDISTMASHESSEGAVQGIINSKVQTPIQEAKTSFLTAASILDAKLRDKGKYYFPKNGYQDLSLDLSAHPLMEFKDGSKVLFSKDNEFSSSDTALIQSFWKKFNLVPISFQSDFEQIIDALFKSNEKYGLKNQLQLEDQGIIIDIKAKWVITTLSSETNPSSQYKCIFILDKEDGLIPDSVKIYLNDRGVITKEIFKNGIVANTHENVKPASAPEKINVINTGSDIKQFVRDLINVMGFTYSENISISFPYAGIQINALSNLISSSKGNQLLVDYGELYGDAVSTIEKTGLKIVQINPQTNWEEAVFKILRALNISYSEKINLLAANRPEAFNISFNIPGINIKKDKGENILLTKVIFHNSFAKFVNENGFKIIQISE